MSKTNSKRLNTGQIIFKLSTNINDMCVIKLKYIGLTSACLKCQTVWIPIRPSQNVGPDLGPNCLQRVISR